MGILSRFRNSFRSLVPESHPGKHLNKIESKKLNAEIKSKGYQPKMEKAIQMVHPEHLHHYGHDLPALKAWFKTNPAHYKQILDTNNISIHEDFDKVVKAVHENFKRNNSKLYTKKTDGIL